MDQPLTVYPSELLPEQPLTADTVNNPVVEAQEARNDGTIPLREQVLSSTPPRPKLRVDVADDGSLHVNTSDSGMEPTNHARSVSLAIIFLPVRTRIKGISLLSLTFTNPATCG